MAYVIKCYGCSKLIIAMESSKSLIATESGKLIKRYFCEVCWKSVIRETEDRDRRVRGILIGENQ